MTGDVFSMVKRIQGMGRGVLEIPIIATVRRNHAIEHATIHVLTSRRQYRFLAGQATREGFLIYGAVDSDDLISAAKEALARLRAGEKHLAIHPRCGTNLAVAGFLTGLAAFLALGGRGSRWLKIPRLLLATTTAVIASQPLGLLAQEHITTSPQVGDVQILRVTRKQPRGVWTVPVHLVHIG